ncbi:MAG TPA: JAB domain-containing protein [Beijerinckiaceae bacterium]|nr:JAB domain-containing protein [Beijerinckiaceae bacterium]
MMSAVRIMLHNHPSGNPTPSDADIRMTPEIASAAKLLGIELLDHISSAATDTRASRVWG